VSAGRSPKRVDSWSRLPSPFNIQDYRSEKGERGRGPSEPLLIEKGGKTRGKRHALLEGRGRGGRLSGDTQRRYAAGGGRRKRKNMGVNHENPQCGADRSTAARRGRGGKKRPQRASRSHHGTARGFGARKKAGHQNSCRGASKGRVLHRRVGGREKPRASKIKKPTEPRENIISFTR